MRQDEEAQALTSPRIFQLINQAENHLDELRAILDELALNGERASISLNRIQILLDGKWEEVRQGSS